MNDPAFRRTSARILCGLFLAFLLGACGKKPAPSAPRASGATASDYSAPSGAPNELDEMKALEAELYRDAPRADADGCGRGCGRAQKICALSDRICELAAESASDRTLEAQCSDGRARCERAHKHVDAQCSCDAPPP